LLRLNVYFDNPVPTKGGDFEDRGGFWAPVEIWHRDAAHWKDLYQKGMRVLVVGRMEREPWTDNEDQPRETWQINARSVGILPFRIESVPSARSRRRRAEAPGRPGTGGAEEPSAGSDPAWGRPQFAALHARELSPGDSSINVHRLPRAPEIAAPGPHTPAARHPAQAIPSA
jgi:single-strand DNA-binding protein